MKNYLYILLTALLLSGTAGLKAQNVLVTMPQSGSYYSNPVIKEDAPDPSVIRADDGYFYLYATGENIYRSKNLTSWSKVGKAFTGVTRPSFVEGVSSYWAPDINKIGDKYVLYYSLSIWGGDDDHRGVGVAYADKPTGPFTIANGDGKMFLSSEIGVVNSIDQFYIEDGGKKYLVWGSYNGIYAIELTDDGLNVKEGAEKVKIGGTAYEGSLIYKRGEYYYYFGSNGTCCRGAESTYRTVYARSTSLLGPYVTKSGGRLLDNRFEVLIQGNDIFAGTGHNAEIVEDDNGDTWILYHGYVKATPNKGRQVFLDRILWTSDGWPYVPNSEPSNQSPKPYFK